MMALPLKIKWATLYLFFLIIWAGCLGKAPPAPVPPPSPPSLPQATPQPTSTPGALSDEIRAIFEKSLLERARTDTSRDFVFSLSPPLQGYHLGKGIWTLVGNGRWLLKEVGPSIQPLDEEARQVLARIEDLNPRPTPRLPIKPQPPIAPAPTPILPGKPIPAVVGVQGKAGMASGFIGEKGDYVITLARDVQELSSATIQLPDRRLVNGLVVGKDEVKDIALLKITGASLLTFPFGDSSRLKVGDEVVALGFSSEAKESSQIASGKIIALLPNLQKNVTYIQTTIPMTANFRGGPLLDARGLIAGINLDFVPAGVPLFSEGTGYAVAIDNLIPVIRQLATPATPAAPAAPGPLALPSPSVPAGWNLYTSQTWQYSINYPPGWSLKEARPERVEIESPDSYAKIFIFASFSTKPIDEWVPETLDSIEKRVWDFEMLYKKPVTKGPLQGWEIAYEGRPGRSFVYEYRDLMVSNREETFWVSAQAWNNTLVSMPALEIAVSSFQKAPILFPTPVPWWYIGK